MKIRLIFSGLLLLCSALGYAKPLIGINIDVGGDDPTEGRLSLNSGYVDAVTSAGGIPIILPPAVDPEAIPRFVELCDGFVMSGGRDINPARYEATTVSEHTNLVNPRREHFDLALIDAVIKANKPLLGVCLGCQEINVALGGSMVQDLPTETSSTINHKPGHGGFAHAIDITTGTLLEDIVGTTTLQVNSMHHQACDRLGSGVVVMARAPDGTVESYKVEMQDFTMGVQWHPEAMTSESVQLKIYEALVKAAERSSRARR